MNILTVHQAAGYQITQKTASEFSSSCPVCGGRDRFLIWPEAKPGGRAYCRQCSERSLDLADYIQQTRQCSYPEAKAMIEGDSSLPGTTAPIQAAPKQQAQDNPERARYIYGRCQWRNQWATIQKYFATRKLVIDPGLTRELGLRISKHNGELAIVAPIRTPGGEIVQLQKIILNEDFTKKEKRLIGRYTGDRGLLIRRSPERLVVVEGIEDCLTILLRVRTDASLLTCFGTSGFSRIGGFTEQYPNVVCILDNDSNGASLNASSKLPQGVKRLLPAMTGIDVNSALQQGILSEWIKSLKEIKQP